MSERLRLFGMHAVVTGAAGSIGEAIVRTLLKQGASVLAIDSINSGVDHLFANVKGVSTASLDVTSAQQNEELKTIVADAFDVVDIVICNLETRIDAPLSDNDPEGLKRLLSLKSEQVAGICLPLIPLMHKSPAGRIVILGHDRSVFALDGGAACARAESALAHQVSQLALECAPHGINVNYIQPGAIMTSHNRRIYKTDIEFRDYCIGRSSAKRLGEPVDIAKVALFLSTDESVFVSGTGIRVDGGISGSH